MIPCGVQDLTREPRGQVSGCELGCAPEVPPLNRNDWVLRQIALGHTGGEPYRLHRPWNRLSGTELAQ